MARKLRLIPRFQHVHINTRTLVYDLHRLTESPRTSVELTKDDALHLYKNMQLIRKLEKLVSSLYRKNIVRGFCHLYMGQEACAVGVTEVLRPKDSVIATYRCHGWAMLLGKDINESLVRILAELMGKSTGTSRGKGGSMHCYTDRLYGGQAIVGSPVPLGTGIALAHKYRGDGGLCLAVIGDAAVNQGQVHEAFNFAKLQDLPVLYLIENNLFGMGTASRRGSANTDYYKRGDLIPGIRTDGNDVIAVREAARYAVDHVTAGKGPILLELITYRYSGHSMSDPGTTYRTREEVDEHRKKNDPIKKLHHLSTTSDLVTEAELEQIKNDVKKILENALKIAKASKNPKIEEVTCDVYKEYNQKIRLPGYGSYGIHKNTVEEALPLEEKAESKI